MPKITVGQLRAHLETIPDDTIIIGDESDHTFRRIWSLPEYHLVWRDEYDQYTLVYGDNIKVGDVDEDYGVAVQALIIE